MREQGKEGVSVHPPSHLASHGENVKVRYTEKRKGKGLEEKESQDNLKLGKAIYKYVKLKVSHI